jgi:hypothetical protein
MNEKQQQTHHIVTVLLGEIGMLRADGASDQDIIRGLLGAFLTVAERKTVDREWAGLALFSTAEMLTRSVP